MSASMSVLEHIRRVKTPLIVLEFVFVAAFVAELYYLRDKGAFEPRRAEMIALMLPLLGFFICFFPLCYYAWFHEPLGARVRFLRLLFFSALLLVCALCWFNMFDLALSFSP